MNYTIVMIKYGIMARKNIDVVTKYFYPIAAGIETNTLETYSVLAKKGWAVTIHTSKDTYLEKNSLKDFEEIRGLKVKRYPFKSELTGYMPQINWDKTDVVALHNFNVSHFRIILKTLFMKLFKKKNFALVITPHGGFNPEWKIFKWPTRIIKFIYQYFIGNIIASIAADGFRAVSEWERREMVKKGISNKKIEVITNGLEDEAFMNIEKLATGEIKRKVKNFGEYIIQIGRIYPIKNYETVIKALPLTQSNLNYVIVGQVESNSKYKEYLINLAKKLGVSDRLHFTGVVRGVDKYYLIKKAKMMVHMAIWESFCNVVHEGLSQGLICIVANNTALPLLIKDGVNGYTIKTHDHKALAEKINFVVKNFNSKSLIKMRSINKKINSNDSWKSVAGKLSHFYELLINKVRKKQVKKPKKVGKFLLTLSVTIFSLLILAVSIRGNYGNPNPAELLTDYWKDSGPFEVSPERGRYTLLYSILEDKSFHFSEDLARFVVPDLGYMNGNYVSLFAPAVSFIAMPGYLIGKMLNISQVGAFATIAVFALLNSYLIKKISEALGASSTAAALSGILFIFATPAFAYGVSLYQHHVSASLILCSIYALIRGSNFLTLSVVWFLSAMAIPVDYPNLFLMLPIGLAALSTLFKFNRSGDLYKLTFRTVYVVTFLTVVIPLGFFLWFNKMSYGDPIQFSGTVSGVRAIDENGKPTAPKYIDPQNVEEYLNPEDQDKNASAWFESRNLLSGIYIHFLSPDRGIFTYTPVVLFGVFGIFVLYQKGSKILNILLSVIGMNILLYSMWGDPWGGWAFGSRYMIPSYAIFAILLASALTQFNRKWYFILPFYLVMIYSIGVGTLGALTTSAIPPKAESLALEKVSGKHERFSIDRNWEYLKAGGSKSFVFRTWGSKYIDSVGYFYTVAGLIALTASLLTAGTILNKNEKI